MFYHFSVELAQRYGIENAVIIHSLYTWIAKNAADGQNAHEGRYWSYCSMEAWAKLHPFMCLRSIKSHIAKLIENDIFVKGNYNESTTDRTAWYAFSDNGMAVLSDSGYNINTIRYTDNAKCKTCTKHSANITPTIGQNLHYVLKENIEYNIENKEKIYIKKKADEPDFGAIIESAAQYQAAPPPTPSPAETKQAAFERSVENFREELKKYIPEFGEEMIIEFFDYWSEPNKSRTKMRKDMQPTWDTHRRLLTWFRNNNKQAMRHGTYLERKEAAKRQSDMESMQRLAAIAARGYSPEQENDEELGF